MSRIVSRGSYCLWVLVLAIRKVEVMMKNSKRLGFTLIELMLVVVIISILLSVLFPLLYQYQISAKRSRCIANMRQVCNAVESRRAAVGNAAVETTWCSVYVNENGHAYFQATPYCPNNTIEPYDISTATVEYWRPFCKMTQEPFFHVFEL